MGNKKRFAVSMIATIIAFVVQLGVNFVLTPYIIATLGTEAYGFVPLVNNVVGYSSIIATALNSMAGRFIGVAFNRGETEKAKVYFNSVLAADAVIALVLAIPFTIFALFPDVVMNVPADLVEDVRWTFAFAALSTEFTLLLSVYGTVYYVNNRLEKSALRNIEGNMLRAGVLVALFVAMPPKIFFVTASMLVLNFYNCIANIYYTRKFTPELTLNFRLFRWSAIREVVSAGVWGTVNNLSYTLLLTLDLYLANRFVGPLIGGQYSLAKTMPTFLTNIAVAMAGVFAPQILQYYAHQQHRELADFTRFSIKFMGFAAAMPIGYLMIFGREFFSIWTPGEDSGFLQSMAMVSLIAMIPSFCTMAMGSLFTAFNKVKVPALVFLACGVLNVILVIPLLMWTDLGIWTIIIVAGILDFLKNFLFVPLYAAMCIGESKARMLGTSLRGCLCVMPMVVICLIVRHFVVPTGWPTFIGLAVLCCCLSVVPEFFLAFNRSEQSKALNMIRAHIPFQVK